MEKSSFAKNIAVTGLLFLNTIIFFKIITFYSNAEVLANYFAVKALASIFFFGLSLRFPEILYILKGKLGLSLSDLKGVHYLFLLYIFLGVLILLFVSYLTMPSITIYIAAFFILVSNEIVESFMSMQRLFNRYMIMIFYRLILLLKPIVLMALLYSNCIILDNSWTIIAYETILIAGLLLIYILYNYKQVYSVRKRGILLLKNLDVIKNTWFASISKITYDALPNYLLSFFVADVLYAQFNVARKIYGLIHSAQWSFVQVFNTVSIELKDKYVDYLHKYYKLMISLNILSVLGIVFLGKIIIATLTKETYATETTIGLILTFVIVAFLYVLFYPIRQWFVLNKLIEENNKGIKISMIILLLISMSTIPIFGVAAAAVIQPFGLLMPILATMFILPSVAKNKLKLNYLILIGRQ